MVHELTTLLPQLLLLYLALYPVFFNIDADKAKQTHVHVRYPNQRETGDEITAPIIKQQLIIGNEQENYRNVMAKTIFAGKQVEELAF